MIDALTHLDFPALDMTREQVVRDARSAGVERWVVAGTEPSTWDRTSRVSVQTQGILALGVHPWWASACTAAALAELADRRPAAVGEIGLDRARDGWDVQVAAFRAQLAVARAIDRPVILHVVRAWPEVRAILLADGLPRAGGMVHGWSGPPDAVPEAEAAGLMISFGTTVLRGRAGKVREAARRVSLDRLLLETDSPEHGEPAALAEVAAGVAACRGEVVQAIARASSDNATRLFAGGG